MLETKNVVKRYMRKTAVDGLSFDIPKGKIVAILGPNGSGKTTWMKMVAGLIKPTSGQILYDGKEIGTETKSKIAYMSTEPWYYNYMTVKDVGKYYSDFFADFDPNRFDLLVDRLGLNPKDKNKNLSSGLAAKLKIAATLARRAELYMLDEPLNGIDIIARELIIETIVETANENNTIILSSHLVEELEKIIDVAIYIKNGTLMLAGDAEQLTQEHGKSIVDIYKQIYAQ